MDPLARLVGIFMVVITCIAFGVEGIPYGDPCTGDGTDHGNCAEATNIVCDTICKCSPGFFRETTAAACAAQIALNANCNTAQTAPDQCSIANSECRDDSGTDKCLCKPTHYETGGACELKIALNANCDTAQTASDQCSIANSECRDDGTGTDKCLCESTHYETGGACELKVALNANCDTTQTAPDQCSIANSECRGDGTGTDKCLCESTHYETGGACELRKYPDANCGGDECVINAACVSTKCVCDAGYTPSPTVSPTMCNGVVKITTLTHMYAVPILVSLMFFLR